MRSLIGHLAELDNWRRRERKTIRGGINERESTEFVFFVLSVKMKV